MITFREPGEVEGYLPGYRAASIEVEKQSGVPFNEQEERLSRFEDRMGRAFEDAVAEWTEGVSREEVAAAFAGGGIAAVFALLRPRDLQLLLRENLRPLLAEGIEEGVELSISRFPERFSFPAASEHPMALAWMNRHAAEMVKEVSDNTKRAIRSLIVRGRRDGLRASAIADSLFESGAFGLTPKQALAADNFRRAAIAHSIGDVSESSILNRFRLARDVNLAGVRQGRVGQAVDRYKTRMLRHRASVIASQEAVLAISRGRQMAWEEMAREGLIDRQESVQRWITALDERTCFICIPMHNQRRALGDLFDTGDGRQVERPGDPHPACRCVIVLEPARVSEGVPV